MKKSAGELRRSFAVSTFGPGAVVDLRGDGAPLSVVMGGLEVWEDRGGSQKDMKRHAVYEPRLQKKLDVKRFLLPPVMPDDDENGPHLAGVRFPAWLVCPECHELRRGAGKWQSPPGKAGCYCAPCTAKAPGQRKVWAIPVRFVTACARGHLDEFPWDWWVQHRENCGRRGSLKLESRGSGLVGMALSCTECGAERRMDGIFSKDGLRGLTCKGHRPWLPAKPEACSEPLMAMQRGASNLYFPIIDSALTIPPFSERLVDLYGEYWEAIRNCEATRRLDFVRDLWPTLPPSNYTPEQVVEFASLLDQSLKASDEDDLRHEEYGVLDSPTKYDRRGEEFSLRPGKPTATIAPYLARVSRVVRLREVRAMRAFTRLTPPTGDFKRDSTKAAWLSCKKLDWLPAIEVRGEGLFISLDLARLARWETNTRVRSRTTAIDEQHALEFRERFGVEALPSRKVVTPRFVLVHSLAHALIRHLALDCGYSSASLRERTYAEGHGESGQAGVLIYTGTTDADGTLGGLVRQGRPSRFEEVLVGAIRDLQWCSSDPLCIEGMAALSDGMNGAACHACLLASETSCEHFNRFLDRALLIGIPDDKQVGFFSDLME